MGSEINRQYQQPVSTRKKVQKALDFFPTEGERLSAFIGRLSRLARVTTVVPKNLLRLASF